MSIIFEFYQNTENVEFRDSSRTPMNIMYTIMTEIISSSSATDILNSIFGYRQPINNTLYFLSLFENIENILDSSLQNDLTNTKETATKDMIKELGPYKLVKCNSELCNTTCSICLSDFYPNEGYRTLKCCHSYHKKCIDKWFTDGSQECPMCRSNPWSK